MEGKPWYLSKTLWGLAIVAAGAALAHWNLVLTADDATLQSVLDIVSKVAEAVGLALALYGRIKAQQPLTGKNGG